MFTKKKTTIISLLSALVAGVLCSMVVYSLTSQSMQVTNADFYGTYQFDIRDLEHTEYLAVTPPSAGDAAENVGEFQWYTIDGEILAQGTCKIDKEGFVTLYVNGNTTATIFVVDVTYYFVNNSLEPQEITKLSKEPMVATPF